MAKTFLFCISVGLNILLIRLLGYKNKQIKLVQKIRVSYEKRCNSFRIRYTILSRMEGNFDIIDKLMGLNSAVYIYGSGVIGKKLNNIINQYSNINVLGFLEGKELENNKCFADKIDKKAIIIVTPVFDYDNIVKLLMLYTDKSNILSIDEIL